MGKTTRTSKSIVMQKVYISGKITGLPMMEVVEKFEAAEQYLKEQGFEKIVNPVKLDHTANINQDYNTFMKVDIQAMMECNVIALLPCWTVSKGATIEFELANKLGFNILFLD